MCRAAAPADVVAVRVPSQRRAPVRESDADGRALLHAAAVAAAASVATSSADLVAAAARGDAEAVGALYDRNVELVFRYAYYRLGERGAAEAVVAESFLAALRDLPAYDWPPASFGAWLVRHARATLDRPYRLTGVVTGADEEFVERFAQLPPEVKECLALRYLHGLSAEDTARVLELRGVAVAGLEAAGLQALRRVPALR